MDEAMEVIRARAEALIREDREFMHELVALRRSRRESQEEIGDRMGISQAAVSQFERYDANPTLSTIRRYALAVGARVEHRVYDDTYMPAVTHPPVQWGQPKESTKTPTSVWGSPYVEAAVCV